MVINGIEKLSLVDYDGLTACTLFTFGCNYKCPFCHNSALVTGNMPTAIPQDEIFGYLTKRKGLLQGVCITGGEPTLHKDLPEFVARIKSLGYKVKLDTNGTNPTMLRQLINSELLDYVAMDIKNSKTKYPLTTNTNANIVPVCRSVDILMQGKIDYEFRTTLVKEYHTLADIEDIAQWIGGCAKYALQHFVDRGSCIADNLHEVDETTAKEYQATLQKVIPNTIIRGY